MIRFQRSGFFFLSMMMFAAPLRLGCSAYYPRRLPARVPRHDPPSFGRQNPRDRIRKSGDNRLSLRGQKCRCHHRSIPRWGPYFNLGQQQYPEPEHHKRVLHQMASYYNEVSYGNIALNIKFYGILLASTGTAVAAGAYTLGHPEEYYGCGDEGVGCAGSVATPTPGSVSANGNYLIHDALVKARAADPLLDSAHFDEVIVMHAGNGNETTQFRNGDIWSIFYSQDVVIPTAGGGFDEGDVVPETETSGIVSPLGVMCHEFGHSLGLPDLYNTSAIGGSSVVGRWEIMDSGPYDGLPNALGANPAHMGAWDKMTLGWVTPTPVTAKASSSLSYVETNPSMLKIPVLNGLPEEYFLVEYRSPTSGATYDKGIPGQGLLIWHIDDAITSSRGINATTPTCRIPSIQGHRITACLSCRRMV